MVLLYHKKNIPYITQKDYLRNVSSFSTVFSRLSFVKILDFFSKNAWKGISPVFLLFFYIFLKNSASSCVYWLIGTLFFIKRQRFIPPKCPKKSQRTFITDVQNTKGRLKQVSTNSENTTAKEKFLPCCGSIKYKDSLPHRNIQRRSSFRSNRCYAGFAGHTRPSFVLCIKQVMFFQTIRHRLKRIYFFTRNLSSNGCTSFSPG